MIANNDSNENDRMLDSGLIPEYVKSEEIAGKKAKTDYSGVYELPTIRTRYTSILIDGICLFLIALGISALFEKIG
ncbi:MAG TPA: hypothetical protein VIH57_01095, partial [Bacteroidales bacterium]